MENFIKGLDIFLNVIIKVKVTYPDTKIVCEGTVVVIHITSDLCTV